MEENDKLSRTDGYRLHKMGIVEKGPAMDKREKKHDSMVTRNDN